METVVLRTDKNEYLLSIERDQNGDVIGGRLHKNPAPRVNPDYEELDMMKDPVRIGGDTEEAVLEATKIHIEASDGPILDSI